MELVILNVDIDLVKVNIVMIEFCVFFDGVIGFWQVSVGFYVLFIIIVVKLIKIIFLKIEFFVFECYVSQVKKGINFNFELEGKLSFFFVKVYVIEL